MFDPPPHEKIKLIKNSKTLSSPAPVPLDPRVERPNNKLYNTNGSDHTHRPEVHAHRLSHFVKTLLLRVSVYRDCVLTMYCIEEVSQVYTQVSQVSQAPPGCDWCGRWNDQVLKPGGNRYGGVTWSLGGSVCSWCLLMFPNIFTTYFYVFSM